MYKLAECRKCKRLFSFNTFFMHRVQPKEVKESGKKVYVVSCAFCGADTEVEI